MPALELAHVLRIAAGAARGKPRSHDVAAFLLDAEASCLSLIDRLRDESWQPGSPRAFWIREPKPRLISALPLRDRVVQHALIERTLPAIERSFAPQSYACRTGFGTHRCLRAAAELSRRHAWVLRLDGTVTERILTAPAYVEATGFYFPEEVSSRVRAWLAHAKHGHTRMLCRRVLAELAFSAG